jgi:D-glucosaminate-6-phosphate ammonia-lyase
MGAVSELGLRPIINACGPATRVGGHRMHSEVAAAMAEAAQLHFAIDELQEHAGAIIAAATGAEAGYVSAGASSGLTLSAAAVIAGTDPVRIDRLPDTDGLPNEILIQAGHRNAYDHALRAAGARIVDVGTQGYPGNGRTHPWQIEAAIGPRTVAIAVPFQAAPGTVALAEVATIAHRHGIAVIVDGAAALPPKENLRRLIAEGADLVAFSGGKAIGGPQASGILAGRADLIRAVALNQLDMDVDARTWRYRPMIEAGTIPGPPHQGIGRSMKVGKEQIVGLLTALQRYAAADEAAELARQERLLRSIADGLASRGAGRDDWPTVSMRARNADGPVTYHVLDLDFQGRMSPDRPAASDRAAAASRVLTGGDPSIYLSELWLDQGRLGVIASTLVDAEADIIVDEVAAAIDILGRRARILA